MAGPEAATPAGTRGFRRLGRGGQQPAIKELLHRWPTASRSRYLSGLAEIAGPTLVLCGRQDQPTPPECHEEMAAAIPNATPMVVEDCGQLAPMERPEAVNAALRAWLAG